MAVQIGSYPAFLEHYSLANPESGLFGFLLYLSSDTHAPVARFASSHKAFLDGLAVNRGMYVYFFVLNKKNAYFNPASYITSRIPATCAPRSTRCF